MSNLQKFNTTLDDFDKEVSKLKSVSEAYRKLENLITSFNEISTQFNENSKTLESINGIQKIQQQKVINCLIELEVLHKQTKDHLTKIIEEQIESLRKDNKDFYKELESTIRIKLDENKSQIKQLIENERTRIKEIFEIEFARNTKELKQTIENEAQKQTQQLVRGQKSIKISLWILGGAILLISIVILIKLLIK
jgi:ABC-type transporter Mla subunit MlaD